MCLQVTECKEAPLLNRGDVFFRAWSWSGDRGLLSGPGELCSRNLHPQSGSGICGKDGRQTEVKTVKKWKGGGCRSPLRLESGSEKV